MINCKFDDIPYRIVSKSMLFETIPQECVILGCPLGIHLEILAHAVSPNVSKISLHKGDCIR